MNAASEYRRRAIESASPVGLVVLLYGGAVTALSKAMAAIDTNNIEVGVSELNRVLKILAELQGTLNFEHGGEVAVHLEKFYTVMRSQVLEASMKASKPMLEELVRHFSGMKEAWQQVDVQTAMNGATGISPVAMYPATQQAVPAFAGR